MLTSSSFDCARARATQHSLDPMEPRSLSYSAPQLKSNLAASTACLESRELLILVPISHTALSGVAPICFEKRVNDVLVLVIQSGDVVNYLNLPESLFLLTFDPFSNKYLIKSIL